MSMNVNCARTMTCVEEMEGRLSAWRATDLPKSMHLLTSNEDDTITIERFDDEPAPPYAILSHTWGPDNEEVTFADIVNGDGRGKVGYEKIHFCGAQARRDGLRYFWVDK